MCNAVDCFTCTNTTCVVCIRMIAEFLKLSALFPSQGMTEIGGGVTVGVVSDCRIGTGANLCEQVFPNSVTVLINNTVLFGNITIVVIMNSFLEVVI